MARPGIESRSPGLWVNTLANGPKVIEKIKTIPVHPINKTGLGKVNVEDLKRKK